MIPQEYATDLKKVIKWSLVLIFILALFLAVLTFNAFKEGKYIGQGVYPSKTLSVSGVGEVFSTPDIAQFTFTVREEEDSVDSSQDAVTTKIDSATKALSALGIEEKDIKTTGYNAYPRYSYPAIGCLGTNCPSRDRVLSGYEVSQTITVKVRDTDKAGEALAAVAVAGVSNISGLQFVIDDQDALIAEARSKAITNAEEKVKQLAKDLGVRVKGVVSFSESTGDDFRAVYSESAYGFGGDSSVSKVAPQLPVGENLTKIQVYITYEIR